MYKCIVHIISTQNSNNGVIADSVREIDSTARIVEHECADQFFASCETQHDKTYEVAVTDIEKLTIPGQRRFDIPVVRFTRDKVATETLGEKNDSDHLGIRAPIFIGEIYAHLKEAMNLARHFFKLRSSLPRLSALTDRERRLVNLAADGVPNKTIAKYLGVSIKTVEKSRRNAYSKLSVNSSAEVASLVTFNRLYSMNEYLSMSLATPAFKEAS